MLINRRECMGLLTLAVAGGAVGVFSSKAQARRVPFTYFGYQAIERGDPDPKRPITPGGSRSYLNIIPGEGCNSLYATVDGAWLLVDTKMPPFGRLLKSHFRYFPGGGSQGLVINTHFHISNTGGNHAFQNDKSIDILCHPNAAKRISLQHILYRIAAEERIKAIESTIDSSGPRGNFLKGDVLSLKDEAKQWQPKDFAPTKVMDGEMDTVTIGTGKERLEIELYHFGPAHTDTDIVVRLPKYNLMCVGDLCAVNTHAHIDRGAKGNSRQWQHVLKKVIDLCDKDTIIVPAQGELTDIQGLKNQITYFDTVRTEVRLLIDQRRQRRDTETMVIEKFKDYALADAGRTTFGAMYDELVAEDRADRGSNP